MSDAGTSVTLIFYKVGSEWWKEPALNLLAAAAQMSSYTHVEIALGEAPGTGGQMANVARIYNDNVGVVSAAHHYNAHCSTAAHTSNPRLCVAGALRTDWAQSTVHVPQSRLLQGGRGAHADLCEAAGWQAL